MGICTFFGHRDCPASMADQLYITIENIIVSGQADTFLVGHQGSFDTLATKALLCLKNKYPKIRCMIVLAYMPSSQEKYTLETVYPEGLECVPPRFAISYRNRWLIQQSDMVITYITRDWGGAAQFVRKAIRYGKTIVPLIADNQQQNGK